MRHSCQVEGIVTSGNEVPLSAGNQRSASAMSVPQSTIDPVVAAGAAAAEKDVSSRRKHWSEEEAPTTAAEPYFARIFADLSAQSDVTPYPVIHGQPVTILQCRFQAHIAG